MYRVIIKSQLEAERREAYRISRASRGNDLTASGSDCELIQNVTMNLDSWPKVCQLHKRCLMAGSSHPELIIGDTGRLFYSVA